MPNNLAPLLLQVNMVAEIPLNGDDAAGVLDAEGVHLFAFEGGF